MARDLCNSEQSAYPPTGRIFQRLVACCFGNEIVEETIRRFGRLDVLVNNAAFQQRQKRLDDLDDASNADSSYITGEVLTLLGGETTAA